MKQLLLFAGAVLFAGGCAQTSLKTGSVGEAGTVELSNRLLRVSVVPAATGSIAQITCRTTGKKLFAPFEYSVSRDDLLPPMASCGAPGARVLLWGTRNLAAQELPVVARQADENQAQVTMRHKFYQAEKLEFERKITLPRGESRIIFDLKITNRDNRPRKVTLWENLVAQFDAALRDEVLIPARGKTDKVAGRGVFRFEHDQLYRAGNESSKEVMIAPAANWIARMNRNNPVILAIRVSPEALRPDGMFYTWKQGGKSVIHTAEVIFTPATLKPDETRCYRMEYLIFPNLGMLHGLAGEFGVNARIEKDQLHITVQPVKSVSSGTWSWSLTDGKTSVKLQDSTLPALKATEQKTLTLTLPLSKLSSGEWRIAGRTPSGENFTLPGPMIRR